MEASDKYYIVFLIFELLFLNMGSSSLRLWRHPILVLQLFAQEAMEGIMGYVWLLTSRVFLLGVLPIVIVHLALVHLKVLTKKNF